MSLATTDGTLKMENLPKCSRMVFFLFNYSKHTSANFIVDLCRWLHLNQLIEFVNCVLETILRIEWETNEPVSFVVQMNCGQGCALLNIKTVKYQSFNILALCLV